MRGREGVAAIIVALVMSGAPAAAKSGLAGCDAFVDRLRLAASDMQVQFTHSLVVSRAKTDVSVFDISTSVDVDATLTCHGDEFVRFEARIAEPATARATTNFNRFSVAAMRSALGWEQGRSETVLRGMAGDAHEFLDASRQRGDVAIAGKTEEHAPGGISLGLIYTDTDRAFIIVSPSG
jgi:hypothetical protein